MTDHILYEAPGGLLGRLLTGKLIENDLEWLFEYRVAKLTELLAP